MQDLIPEQELNAKVKRDLANLLYEQGINGCIVIILVTSTCALAVTNLKPSTFELLWWISLVVLAVFRIFDIKRFLKTTALTDYDGQEYINRFSRLSIVTGFLFSIYPYFSFPDSDFLERSTFVMVVSGLAGGAATVLAPCRNLAITYVCLLLLPPSMYMFIAVEYQLRILSLLGIMYCVVLISSIIRTSRFIEEAAKINHHNEVLVTQVGNEKNLVEVSNIKLQEAYESINVTNASLERKVEERTQALSVLASTDELTGLKNRHTFVKTLNTTIKSCEKTEQKFSILFVDLDGFKEINDIRGHIIGDKVLKEVSSRLQKNVKHKDFLCRWGGDEFVLIIDESDPTLLSSISTRVCGSIQQPINIDFDSVKITASIGIATYPDHGSTTTELVNAADVAMYELKKSGKNGAIIFKPVFLEAIRFEQGVLDGLNCALEKNQFELHYQPIIPNGPDKCVIFESLLRWDYQGKPISPSVFIPIAESCDTILSIGNWVLNQTCRDISNNKLGKNNCVSVNISVRQLLTPGFVKQIENALVVNKVPPWRLQIEITESLFAENIKKATDVLKQIRKLGLSIALDDFGRGFSSLSYLQSLPIDIIKIDRAFIQQIETGGAKIIEATVSIAEAFSYTVIAEGIETENEYNIVKKLGVDYLQGFYFSKPLPHSELDDTWFSETKPLIRSVKN